MTLLKKTQKIIKKNCQLQISEVKQGHLNRCLLTSTGKSKKYKWQKSFNSIYGGYAMLMAKHMIDLPGKRFILQQVNEHSRGGHCEYETYLLDLQGNISNQFDGSYNSKFILDDQFVWFYVSGEKPYSYTFKHDLKIIKLNYLKGKVEKIDKGKLPSNIYNQFWK